MMDRGVMQRQMFAKGGAAGFPDLSGDGKITQKDILMGRGVQMQMGGEPVAAQAAAMGNAMDPMAGGSLDEAAQMASSVGIDPTVVERMLGGVQDQMANLDQAEDYETVINTIRSNEAPIEARYEELAGVVGPEDARATPESVLTLVQPLMEINAMDQGIGSIAQEQMNTPVQGPMAEGIMSTVNMEQPQAASMPGPGGPAPVNFRQGGAVQYMAPGGVAGNPMDSRLGQLYQEQQGLYRSILGPDDQASDFEDQKRMTQAQMLFDVAQGALGFASGAGRPGATPAEQLAASFTPVLGNVGARAGELQKFKQAQAKEGRAMDLAALQAASGLYSNEQAAELSAKAAAAARADKDIGDIYNITLTDKDGKTETRTGPVSMGMYEDLIKKYGEGNVSLSIIPKKTSTAQGAENFIVNGQLVSAIKGTDLHTQYSQTGARAGTIDPSLLLNKEQVTLTADVTIGDKTYKAGSSPNFTTIELSMLPADSYTAFQAPITERDIFQKFGFTSDSPLATEENKAYLIGLPTVTSKDYFEKFGMEKDAFLALPEATRGRMIGYAPDTKFMSMDGKIIAIDPETNKPETIYTSDKMDLKTVDGKLVAVDRDNNVIELFGKDDPVDPDFRIMRKGNVETIIDLSTPAGQAAMTAANLANAEAGATVVTIRNIPAEQRPTAKAFQITGVGNVLSYDGGRTYVDKTTGEAIAVPTDAVPLSDTIAYDVAKNERIALLAGNQLAEMDEQLGFVIKGGTPDNPTSVSSKDRVILRDAMEAARNGTGPYAGFAVFLDRTFAGAIPAARKAFQDTQANRQFLRGLIILGRSALVVNPRFPVAEMEKVGALFPDPDTGSFFANPETEANKLVELKALALDQKRKNLEQLSLGIQDKATVQAVLSNNFELDRLLGLLNGVPTELGQTVDSDTVNSLRSTLKRQN